MTVTNNLRKCGKGTDHVSSASSMPVPNMENYITYITKHYFHCNTGGDLVIKTHCLVVCRSVITITRGVKAQFGKYYRMTLSVPDVVLQ